MSDLRVDFSEVEAAKFDPVPAGEYTLTVTDHEWREAGDNAKNPGAEYIHWELTIQDGPMAGKKVWDNSNFGKESLPFTKAFLEWTGKFPDGIGSVDPKELPEKVLGATGKARIKVKDGYNAIQKWIYGDAAKASGDSSLLP